jgi:hypothetical protein
VVADRAVAVDVGDIRPPGRARVEGSEIADDTTSLPTE